MHQKTLFFLGVLFLLLNIFTLKDGHNWGGDFAQYIRHGQNIAEGRPYAGRIELDERAVSPPGFPLILAPLLRVFGLNFIILKSLNVVFWFLFVLLAYLLMKDKLKSDFAFLGTLVFITSPAFFTFKQNVLTDIPFLFFVTASIYFFTKFVEKVRGQRKGDGFFYAALLCMGYAFLIRWAGILLFAAALLQMIFAKDLPRRKIFFGLGAAFLLSLGIQLMFRVSAMYHVEELHIPLPVYLSMLLKQPSTVFNQMLEFLFPHLTLAAAPLIYALTWTLTWTGPFILAAVLWRVFKHRRTLDFLRWFCVLYLLAVIAWVLFSSWRYVLPLVLPVMIVVIKNYCALTGRFRPGIKRAGENVLKFFLALMIFNNIVVLVRHFDFNDDMIYTAEAREMTAWLRDNTGEDERFMFTKPRVVGLLTGRMGAYYYRFDEGAAVCERMDRFNISYIVTTPRIIEEIERDFAACPCEYEKMWSNDVFQIFKVIRHEISL